MKASTRGGTWRRSLIAVMAACLALVLAGGIAGCSDGQSQTASEQPDHVGAWDFTKLKLSDAVYDAEALDKLRENGYDFFVNLNADGTFLVCLGHQDSVAEGTWVDDGSGKVTLYMGDDPALTLVVDGETAKTGDAELTRVGKVAKKAPPKPAQASSSSTVAESSSSTAASDSGEVSADLKEMLDSYEAVMDEYVDFMQKYKDSGYSASMLGDYTSMMQKYLDFTEKIEGLDTSDMSTADYAYYIEVTGRVSQKLLSVL